MTILRTNAAGWGVGDKLTSSQTNAVDVNVTNALDKRAAQTDTLSSTVTIASGGGLSFASGSTLSIPAGVNPTIALGTGSVTGGNIAAASGIATLTAGSKLLATQRVGWIVEAQQIRKPYVDPVTFDVVTVASYTDYAGIGTLTFVAAGVIGDQLIINGTMRCKCNATSISTVRVVVKDGGVDAFRDAETGLLGVSEVHDLSFQLIYAVVTGGALTVRMQVLAPNQLNIWTASIVGTLTRP